MVAVSAFPAPNNYWLHRGANWWQAAAILAPLLLLAGLGIRGLQTSRQAVLDEARQRAKRGLDQAWPSIREAWEDLLRSNPVLRLYPAAPEPVPPNEASDLYARALDPAASHNDATAALARLAADYPDALAPSGVPLKPLVEWNHLRLETNSAEWPARAAALRTAALRDYPSVITPALLGAATTLLRERGVDPSPLAAWQTQWDQDERARSAWRLHTGEIAAADRPIWVVDSDSQSWWVQRAGDDLSARQIFPRDVLCRALHTMGERTQSFLPDFAGAIFDVDNVQLPPPSRPSLASRQLNALSVRVVVVSSELLFAQQRRQTVWLAALLVCAFITALAGFWSMRRSLARERQLGRLKSDFVSSVSHELRAPVAAMRLMVENLNSGVVPTEAGRQEYHHHLAQECRRLGALIDNVLDFARIEQHRKTYAVTETDVAALVHDALMLMQPRAAERRQELTADLQPVEPPPVCDGLAVRQALINLLENAMKFSPRETAIRVGLRPAENDRWEISVHDEGPGIPAAEHEKVFERFYRLGSELRRETQGAGIGLSIVRHIAEAHGGWVKLASEPGKGATFTMILPLRPPGCVEAP